MKTSSVILSILFFVVLFQACGEGSEEDDGKKRGTTPTTSTKVVTAKGKVCFTKDILPIFVSGCAKSGCHDSSTRKEGIDMSSHQSILASKKGEGVIPSDPAGSRVLKSLTASGEDLMPPPPAAKFTSAQVALVKKWIEEGAQNTTCETTGQCETKNVTYTKVIEPMLKKYCVGCHSTAALSGGLALDTYASAKASALGNKMILSISKQAGAKPMPPGGGGLSDCQVSQVKQWIADGTPE